MFQPFGLYQLFAIPTHILPEHAVEGHSLLRHSISQLYATLGKARSFTTRVSILDEFLLARLSSKGGTLDSHWNRYLAVMAQDRGTHTVRQISASLNISVRQRERRSLNRWHGAANHGPRRPFRLRVATQTNMEPRTIHHLDRDCPRRRLLRPDAPYSRFHLMGGAKPARSPISSSPTTAWLSCSIPLPNVRIRY